jgi:5'-nucleotidase
MKILVTNDDGIHAEGLRALVEALSRDHEVWVIAPDRERSGASHSVNLHEPGRLERRGEREYSCSGTPADCVMIGQLGILGFRPDAVVSGINRGPNLGTDIVYSGTCAAARQAALYGIPGVAVSCASRTAPFLYGGAASFVARKLGLLLGHCSESIFMNVNAPCVEDEGLEGEWATIARRHYHDSIRPVEGENGQIVCYLESGKIESIGGRMSDEGVVATGLVAVSPVLVHPQVPVDVKVGARFN